jgi:hypothetical protein
MLEDLKQKILRPLQARWNSFLDHNPEKYLFVFPLVTFLFLLGAACFRPAYFLTTPMIDWKLPSEAAIPQEVLSNNKKISDNKAEWTFRYAPTGTEFGAGIPYWIFRVIPKIFSDTFQNQGWKHFGFMPDNQDYYTERQNLPSGMVLSDTKLDIPFAPIGVALKRVSLNCSACHRGGVMDGPNLVLIDGMPNHTADLQAFKRFMMTVGNDDRFNAPRIISEINQALHDDKKPPLTFEEQVIYTAIVAAMRKPSTPTSAGNWMSLRPDNGPGRIDPFNSVKFEKIGVKDDFTDGTEDFPSIWNQDLRYWHHYDGNTASLEARNFGSALGVGADSISIHRPTVRAVGDWIESKLAPPTYPFFPTSLSSEDKAKQTLVVARGKDLYQKDCASCHGIYDPENRTISLYDSSSNYFLPYSKGSLNPAQLKGEDSAVLPWSHYMKRDVVDAAADQERLKTFNQISSDKLNEFGSSQDLWPAESFRPDSYDAAGNPTNGYLNGPLDGIWARAPYLHNGSVPTLDDLLKPDSQRPKDFYTGSTQYDTSAVGFQSKSDRDGNRQLFHYETSQRGNSNLGHNYPPSPLSDPDRAALLEYLKTL